MPSDDIRKLGLLQRRAWKLEDDIAKLKAKVAKSGCPHPESHQYHFEQDNDDGYGHWWKTKVISCTICGARCTYGNWSPK